MPTPLKILILHAGLISQDPYLQLSFETAWLNASGSDFNGTITQVESVSNSAITQSYLQTYIDAGYTMVIRNAEISTQNLTVYQWALTQGMIAVMPTGSNNYREYKTIADNNNVVVFCGSGVEDVGNATGYPCLFYAMSDIETPKTILSITQVGSEIEIVTAGDFYYTAWGITIQGVSGFSNNPNGIKAISDGDLGTTFRIVHTLGSGSYTAGSGSVSVASQSYGTPKVAGQLAYIQYACNETDWTQTVSRAIQTASNTSFDTYSGFGNINVDEAIEIFNTRTLTAPVLSLTLNSGNIFDVEWTIVANAQKYEVWFRGELITEYPAHITKHRFTLDRQDKNKKNYVKIRAINGNDYMDSNPLEIKYYYNKRIIYKAA